MRLVGVGVECGEHRVLCHQQKWRGGPKVRPTRAVKSAMSGGTGECVGVVFVARFHFAIPGKGREAVVILI